MSEPAQKLRIDKWLWHARFFKTRALATEAVNGGKVHLNGQRVKPAKAVNVGDELSVQRGNVHFVIIVEALSDKRRPAKEAQRLYRETEDSIAERERLREMQRLAAQGVHHGDRKPSKQQRQKIIRFKRKQ